MRDVCQVLREQYTQESPIQGKPRSHLQWHAYLQVAYLSPAHCVHRVSQMITSAGGCCDCGDPEAWTDGVYCSLHEPEGNEAEEEQVGGGVKWGIMLSRPGSVVHVG